MIQIYDQKLVLINGIDCIEVFKTNKKREKYKFPKFSELNKNRRKNEKKIKLRKK